jgi:hypothetical protein
MRLKDSFDSPNGGTCEKMREVFVLHPVMEKNLSRFFKIVFICPESLRKKTGQNWKKMVL